MSKQEKVLGYVLSIAMLLLAIWGFFVFKVYFLILVIPLTVFGTLGLLIFPWSGQGALTAQLSYILMTISAGWAIYINRKLPVISTKIICMIYGVSLLIALQNWYCRATADILKNMLNI